MFTKEDDKYIVTLIRSKKRGILGSILGNVYINKILTNYLGKSNGLQMGRYQETLDEVVISEHQILHSRKHIKKLKEG